MWVRRPAAVAATVLAAGVLLGCEPTTGDLVVTKTADTNDGRCDTDCSLREAVVAANTRPGRDTVRVPAGTFVLTLKGPDEDSAATGDLDVTDALVLQGAGASGTVLHGGHLTTPAPFDRVLDVRFGVVEVRDLRVTGGRLDRGNGGGIRSSGALTLVDVRVDHNSVTFSGAGIASEPGGGGVPSLVLRRTTVESNSNTEEGTGIYSRGALRILDSTLRENRNNDGYGGALDNGGAGEVLDSTLEGNANLCGGGATNGPSGQLVIRRSRIVGNDAFAGGGIRNYGDLRVEDSEVSGNTASEGGGGIANQDGVARLVRVTVAANTAADEDHGGCGGPDRGGGLYNSAAGTFSLRDTTVAFNDDAGGDAPDCSGTYVDRGGNNVGSLTGCSLRVP